MEQLKRVAEQAVPHMEHIMDSVLTKKRRKNILSFLGPALLVVTFVEDGARVFFRWGEQIQYMEKVMKMNYYMGVVCLVISAAVQIGSSFFIVRPRSIKPVRVKPACYTLLGFVCTQPFMYGQARDLDFMCRSITLVGGLLLLTWSENDRQRRSDDMGLPQDEQGKGADRLQLSGRLLLTFLFFFQALWSNHGGLHSVVTNPTFFRVFSMLLLLVLSGLVCVGFKTEWSAIVLTVVLGVSNIWMYPFWRVHYKLQDFYKYYFFQTLSVMGGLLLLTLHGPGGYSLDKGAKKSI